MPTQTEQTSEKPVLSTKQKIFYSSLFAVLIHVTIGFSVLLKNGKMFTLNDLKEIPFLWNMTLPWGFSRWYDILIGPICAAIYFPITADPAWQLANLGMFVGLFSGITCLFFIGCLCGIATGLFYGVCIGLLMAWIGGGSWDL